MIKLKRWWRSDDVTDSVAGSGADFEIVNGNVARIFVAACPNEHQLQRTNRTYIIDQNTNKIPANNSY